MKNVTILTLMIRMDVLLNVSLRAFTQDVHRLLARSPIVLFSTTASTRITLLLLKNVMTAIPIMAMAVLTKV